MPSTIRVDMVQHDPITPTSIDFTLDWFYTSNYGRQMSWHFEPPRDVLWHFNWDTLEENYIFILIASNWKAPDGKAGIQPFGPMGPIGTEWIVEIPGGRTKKIPLLFPRTYFSGTPGPGPTPGAGGWNVGNWNTEPWNGTGVAGGWDTGVWGTATWDGTGSGGGDGGGGSTNGSGGGGSSTNGSGGGGYTVCSGITFTMDISGDIMVFLF